MKQLRTDSDTGETVDQLFRRNCGADRGFADWRDEDPPRIKFDAKTYVLAVMLAAVLFLVLYPFAH